MSENGDFIEIDKMSIDQFAGSVVLILGAIGSLLLVIWQSRCACKCRIGCSEKCYIFDCTREPPNQQEVNDLEEERKEINTKNKEKEEKEEEEEENIIP
jgi:uncharacterized membrane protein YhiD involved in acid resistance